MEKKTRTYELSLVTPDGFVRKSWQLVFNEKTGEIDWIDPDTQFPEEDEVEAIIREDLFPTS